MRIETGPLLEKRAARRQPDPGHGSGRLPGQPYRRGPAPAGHRVACWPGRRRGVRPGTASPGWRRGSAWMSGRPPPSRSLKAMSSTPGGRRPSPAEGSRGSTRSSIAPRARPSPSARERRSRRPTSTASGMSSISPSGADAAFSTTSARPMSRAGDGALPGGLGEAGPFTNVYEETKAAARSWPGTPAGTKASAQRLPADDRLRRLPDGPDPAL